ncbi:MAG: YraN family protein [Lachnospiraceae bacterium]
MNKANTGARGEVAAARSLRERGYAVITANYRCRLGEIDIIAENVQYICFVEVKTRAENSRYAPADAVDTNKRKKLIAAAQLYLAQHPTVKQPRFDIAEVFVRNGSVHKVHWIENAYDGDGK